MLSNSICTHQNLTTSQCETFALNWHASISFDQWSSLHTGMQVHAAKWQLYPKLLISFWDFLATSPSDMFSTKLTEISLQTWTSVTKIFLIHDPGINPEVQYI